MKKIFLLLIISAAALRLVAQCVPEVVCPANPADNCDLSPNDSLLWHESYWYDPVTGTSDLSDAPVFLNTLLASSPCSASLTAHFLLFLDLDGDGADDTVINSDSLGAYPAGQVPFGNAANGPGYGGGEWRTFDSRPVGQGDRYRFALASGIAGSGTEFSVVWTTANDPGSTKLPELPYGTDSIAWVVRDDQGNEAVCQYILEVRDCKKPTVVCLNGQTVEIPASGIATLHANDFLQYVEDNYSTSADIELAIRRPGNDTGFPQDGGGNPIDSVSFLCTDIGPQLVELWSRDQHGNADFCETYVFVEDPVDHCGPISFSVQAQVKFRCDGSLLNNWNAEVSATNPAFPPIQLNGTAGNGSYFHDGFPLGSKVGVTPSYNSFPHDGLEASDLVLISRHILALQPLQSPLEMIAADVNRSGSITGFDIITIRYMILGIYDAWPNNQDSWRFVPLDFNFPNPNNPFQTPIPEDITLGTDTSGIFNDTTVVFWAIKTGDVDCSATAALAPASEDRNTLPVLLPEAELSVGDRLALPLRAGENGLWEAFQLGLRFDPTSLEIESVSPGGLPEMDASSFAQPHPGQLNAVWAPVEPQRVEKGRTLFTLNVRALKPLNVKEEISMSQDRIRPAVFEARTGRRSLVLTFDQPDVRRPIPAAFAPRPNPTTAGAMLPLHLNGPERVLIELSDAAGTLVYRFETDLPRGDHNLELPATALARPGVYFWRLHAGSISETGKLIRL